jgi:hypothetical protein
MMRINLASPLNLEKNFLFYYNWWYNINNYRPEAVVLDMNCLKKRATTICNALSKNGGSTTMLKDGKTCSLGTGEFYTLAF